MYRFRYLSLSLFFFVSKREKVDYLNSNLILEFIWVIYNFVYQINTLVAISYLEISWDEYIELLLCCQEGNMILLFEK